MQMKTASTFTAMCTLMIGILFVVSVEKSFGAERKTGNTAELDTVKQVALHKKVDEVLTEMRAFVLRDISDAALAVEMSRQVIVWRMVMREARKGKALSAREEKEYAKLEKRSFLRHAQHAYREFENYTTCQPSRFAERHAVFGWTTYHDAAISHTHEAIGLAIAAGLEEAEILEYDFSDDLVRRLYSKELIRRSYSDICAEKNKGK